MDDSIAKHAQSMKTVTEQPDGVCLTELSGNVGGQRTQSKPLQRQQARANATRLAQCAK
jgi:hypothetical protein